MKEGAPQLPPEDQPPQEGLFTLKELYGIQHPLYLIGHSRLITRREQTTYAALDLLEAERRARASGTKVEITNEAQEEVSQIPDDELTDIILRMTDKLIDFRIHRNLCYSALFLRGRTPWDAMG